MSVVSIEGRTRAEEINRHVVALLEQYLEMATAGKLAGIAIAAIELGGVVRTANSPTGRFHDLLGAVSILQHEMIAAHICTCGLEGG